MVSSLGMRSSPLESPKRRSRKARSLGCCRKAVRAASGVAVAVTAQPSCSRQRESVARIFFSSSTTSTLSFLGGKEVDLLGSIFLVLSYAPCRTEMQQAAESSVEGAGFEIRNSKYEIRNKLNDPNSELSSKRAFRVCCFGFSFNLKFVWLRFVSAFDIRIWILVLDMRKR